MWTHELGVGRPRVCRLVDAIENGHAQAPKDWAHLTILKLRRSRQAYLGHWTAHFRIQVERGDALVYEHPARALNWTRDTTQLCAMGFDKAKFDM